MTPIIHKATTRALHLTAGLLMTITHSIAIADFPPVYQMSSLAQGNGLIVNGVDDNHGIGRLVSSAGDFNGDGIGDVLFSASQGRTYVLFGDYGNLSSPFNILSIDGGSGIIIVTATNASSISGAGDINGDGIDDVIIGNQFDGTLSTGSAYVIFGSNQPLLQTFNVSNLDGSNGFAIPGLDFDERTGASVSAAGDLNNDGLDDVLVGVPLADNGAGNSGTTYVIYGQDQVFSAIFDLAGIDGENGIAIHGIANFDRSGSDVANAGDFNGDGIDDLIIGAPGNPNLTQTGRSYVIFGSENLPHPFSLSTLNGANGFAIPGIDPFDHSGFAVSSAGDLNGDGLDEVLIGAYGGDPFQQINAGESYVLFGSTAIFPAAFALSDLDGNNGFLITGIDGSEESGKDVNTVGDVNGDGFDDILIGAPEGSNAGRAYLIYGRAQDFANPFETFPLLQGEGSRIQGRSLDRFGASLSGAGDFNNDGVNDLIIGGAGNRTNGVGTGTAYVLYGNDSISVQGFEG